MCERLPRLSLLGASLALAPTIAVLDLVMMTTAARYGRPNETLAAMDILANIIIRAVRDAH
ncbi:hypothetical protein [Bradyrhizobium sp. NAS96.2]|uniref:hypothetical protein n=1 Tax=Bradyrhizobium sp. NAS96.2 TaxID=1680160 RepID=UPI00093E7AE5|nr:hypothetical protein [Bradyrhizobium sp. NAS96.2]OKO76448.1 hypothetical protein AC628_17900 [Bradyrhizobium sp. NAS96.2]